MPSQPNHTKKLPQVPKYSARVRSWWWWWEITAAVLSIISNLLIVVLLFKIDQTSLSSWILPIQPSSLLSALTTISKTSVLVPVTSCLGQLKWRHFFQRPRPLSHLQIFDDATRGPWGSLVMFERLIFREHLLALLATGLALCNILALGIDSSAQQLIALDSRDVRVQNSSAVVARAGAYYSRSWDFPAPDAISPEAAANLSLSSPERSLLSRSARTQLQSKLKAVLFKTSVENQPPYSSCLFPARQCEWDEYSTLGVCSRSWNVTDSVRQNCTTALLDEDYKSIVQLTNQKPPDDRYYEGICDFHLDQQSLNNSINFGDHHLVAPLSLEYWNKPPDKHIHYGDVLNMALVNTSSTLNSIWIVKVQNITTGFNGTTYTEYESYVTEYYWCHQDLKGVTVSEKGFQVSSKTTRPWASAEGDRFQTGVTPDNTGRTDSIGYDKGGALEYTYNIQGQPTYNITKVVYGEMKAITSLLVGPKLYWDPLSGGAFTHLDSPSEGDSLFSTIYLYDDVETFGQRLADGLTSFVLDPTGDGDNWNATMVPGYMVYSETYFRVRWPWFFGLFFEYLLAVSLLVITIFITRGQPLLKNSVLALLACKLAGPADEHLHIPCADTPEDWDKIGDKMVMQFHKGNDGSLRFKSKGL